MFNLILNDLKKQFGEKILLTPLDIAKIIGLALVNSPIKEVINLSQYLGLKISEE
jgi:hypothetical protein